MAKRQKMIENARKLIKRKCSVRGCKRGAVSYFRTYPYCEFCNPKYSKYSDKHDRSERRLNK